MSESKKFVFDVSITFIASIISMFISFVITVLIGRYLGADDLGLYRLVSTIYGIAMLFAAIGIPAAIIKYVAEFKDDRAKSDALVSSGIITSIVLGIIFSVLFYFSSWIFAEIFEMPELTGLIKILSPVFPFALVGGVLLGLLNGLREMKKYGTAVILLNVSMLVVSVLLIYFGFGVAGVVIGVVISSVVWCLYLLLVSNSYFKISLDGYTQTTKRMLQFSTMIFGVGAINMIIYQTDILLIGYFLTSAQVGYYGIAMAFSNCFSIIPRAVQVIAYPTTSEYWANKNHGAFQSTIKKSMKYTACILLPIGLGIEFFSKEIVTGIFGDGYIFAVLPLQILLIGTIAANIVGSVGGTLASVGRPDIAMRIAGISAIVNVVLNLIFIPRLGIIGAAVASAISFTTSAVLSLYYIMDVTSVSINKKWYLNIGLLTVFFFFLFFIGMNVLNTTLIGFGLLFIYLNMIYFFFLEQEEKNTFNSILHNIIHLFRLK